MFLPLGMAWARVMRAGRAVDRWEWMGRRMVSRFEVWMISAVHSVPSPLKTTTRAPSRRRRTSWEWWDSASSRRISSGSQLAGWT